MKNRKGISSQGLIIGAIILIALYFIFISPVITGGAGAFLEVRYKDYQGNIITPDIGLFAVVGGEEGIDEVQFTINTQNTGDKPLQLEIIDIQPLAFDNAITRFDRTISVGESTTWTSEWMDANQFIGLEQPVTFLAKIRGTYEVAGTTQTLEKTGSGTLAFEPDPEGDFIVTIGGGSFTEDPGVDPPPETGTVKFRAYSLHPGHGYAITTTCGDILTKYGTPTFTSKSGTCESNFGAVVLDVSSLFTLAPDSKLYGSNNVICRYDGVAYYWTYVQGAGTTNTDPSPVEPSKEIAC